MSTSNEYLLFDDRVNRVRQETNDIASRMRLLGGLRSLSAIDQYDLKASEQNLRDAADNIAKIRQRVEEEKAP